MLYSDKYLLIDNNRLHNALNFDTYIEQIKDK